GSATVVSDSWQDAPISNQRACARLVFEKPWKTRGSRSTKDSFGWGIIAAKAPKNPLMNCSRYRIGPLQFLPQMIFQRSPRLMWRSVWVWTCPAIYQSSDSTTYRNQHFQLPR